MQCKFHMRTDSRYRSMQRSSHYESMSVMRGAIRELLEEIRGLSVGKQLRIYSPPPVGATAVAER